MNSDPENTYDIVIIGAGPAGLSFACCLAGTDLKIVMVERSPLEILENPPEDGRDIALTHSSEQALKDLGMWDDFPEDQLGLIREAKVLNGRSAYVLHFDSAKTSADYLGHLVPNYIIRRAAYNSVKDCKNISIIAGVEVLDVTTNITEGSVTLSDGRTLHSKLVIAADSRFSTTRKKMGIGAQMQDFGRVVIVCEMTHTKPHNNTAFECFHYDQTLAILPMYGDKSSVVVTLPADKSDRLLAMSPTEFAADIQRRFGAQLGDMTLVTKLHPYPLIGVYADKFVTTRFALMGDAAVGMHPVTAHGFNLGLKGARTLASEIKAALANGTDIGAASVLGRYQAKHRRVARPLYVGTNALVKLFTDTTVPGRILRGAALRLGNILPPVKSRIVQQLTEIDV
ncbi:MAG: 5-demethoxyubiquinol-8 5-hydroxylase UbiM [Rhodobacteraceae bacterium]|nr:5-demethoxyubiquinol-8 5-hydroxylase UbiM [Paracoccaceae bacterium]